MDIRGYQPLSFGASSGPLEGSLFSLFSSYYIHQVVAATYYHISLARLSWVSRRYTKPKPKKKVIVWVWICCQCNASGMSLSIENCPGCSIERCTACEVRKQAR
ncbi:hypothetical protein DL98DRAFT_266387 [Cadophora sp. DSE1049]|nr:hypothetical protein DL98DRAFT_266387 [Cadophora sp. DSE1049]